MKQKIDSFGPHIGQNFGISINLSKLWTQSLSSNHNTIQYLVFLIWNEVESKITRSSWIECLLNLLFHSQDKQYVI